MSLIPWSVQRIIAAIREGLGPEEARARLTERSASTVPPRLKTSRTTDREVVLAIWGRLAADAAVPPEAQNAIFDAETRAAASAYRANIENFIGTVKVPVGIVGPLRINGLNAHGDFFVPLATTEAALIASYARGAQVATEAGGIIAAVTYEGVLRTPAFVFSSVLEAGLFVDWLLTNAEDLKVAAEATTRHGRLVEIDPVIDANVIYLRCRFTTGDAAGQNMVTIATDALCRHAVANMPTPPKRWYIEGNFSGDKKASFLGFLTGRGRKVTASVLLPSVLVEKRLGVSIGEILEYAEIADLGSRLSGQIGAQGHFANGLAALYMACGQDVACVAESAIGSTRLERRDGDLFASVTLPNIIVGTVGGGTGLPSQSAGLQIMNLQGSGNANALAEVAAATCLCGELSIMAAIAAGHFVRAHRKLARER
jgi:hydroxymethylglutaryl-CoA reductase (NADPH)